MRHIFAILSLALMVGCGGSGGSMVIPTVTSVALTGQVVNAATASGIVGALVEILDGPNMGRSATTGLEGRYNLNGLSPSGFTLRARAQGYQDNSQPVTLLADKVVNFGMSAVP